MPSAVDTTTDVIDICGGTTDCGGKFLLLGVVHLDDVAINGHFAEIDAHIPGAKLRHLVANQIAFLFGDTHLNAVGLVRSAMANNLLSLTTDIFSAFDECRSKNFLFSKIEKPRNGDVPGRRVSADMRF